MNKKFRLLILSGFLLSGMSFAQERIVGGVDVVEGEFPAYVALLKLYGEEPDSYLDQYCGATAIAPNKLLTAAHCEVTPGHVAVPGAVDYKETLNDFEAFDDFLRFQFACGLFEICTQLLCLSI